MRNPNADSDEAAGKAKKGDRAVPHEERHDRPAAGKTAGDKTAGDKTAGDRRRENEGKADQAKSQAKSQAEESVEDAKEKVGDAVDKMRRMYGK
jgi:uncharacterized protein YjbJ (UPF0337 family)